MDAVFIELARRLEAMTPKGVGQETIYNFAFGALYALAQAEQHRYPEQSSEKERSKRRADEVRKLASEMAKTRSLPENIEGEWLGGFYFNDALFRGIVCFEHSLRYHTQLKGNESINVLVDRARNCGFKVEEIVEDWSDIKNEVNALKHRSWDFGEGPTIPYPKSVKIIQGVIRTAEWVFEHSSAS